MISPGLVTFVGAGPGDPELLTIAGQKAIAMADVVLYAGSLIPPEVIAFARPDAPKYDTACMTLEETHAIARANALAGGLTARVHTGDPSIYGALAEQIELLDRDAIPWRIIPGITAAMAAAACAGVSFSLPETAQTLIITRLGGRTPMPPNENLELLARHGASMAIYLTGKRAKLLQAELLKALPSETPVICASRVGWPGQTILHATVGTFAAAMAANNLGSQTVFLVLPAHARLKNGEKQTRSRLYAAEFSHSHRKGSIPPWTNS